MSDVKNITCVGTKRESQMSFILKSVLGTTRLHERNRGSDWQDEIETWNYPLLLLPARMRGTRVTGNHPQKVPSGVQKRAAAVASEHHGG
jgi:hypothetical protein